MKKTETKTKSPKVIKTGGVSVKKSSTVSDTKKVKTTVAKNEESSPKPKAPSKVAVKVSAKPVAKPVTQNKNVKPTAQITKSGKPVPTGPIKSGLSSGGRKGRPRKRKPVVVPEAPPSKYPSGRPKTPKSKSSSSSNVKLVQVVPKQKPAVAYTRPVNKEKILMRYGKPTKRVLFSIDFLLKASPTIVYQFMTTPSALVRWFCDAVDITGEYYTFSWKGSTEVAELIDDIEDERLRFTWLDGEDEDEFFEFRLTTADITDETILEIFDFAWADEVDEQKQLWRTQVDKLRRETGDA